MTQAWSAELVVSAALAQVLIEQQFPQLAPVRVEPLGVGWDNTAYRVNETNVFRFPRRQFAVSFLEAETRLLPTLAPRLPLPVPSPRFVGHPTDKYPWPFAGYPLIPGRSACSAALDALQRARAAEPLARFLLALHAIPAADAAHAGAGPDPIARLDLERILRARRVLDQLARDGVLADIRPFTAILDDAPATYLPRSDTLVHGDLYVRHLLVDSALELAGVIDWGDVHLGDPAADLMVAHTFLPPAVHGAFRRAYGPIEDTTWQMARLRAVWHTSMVLAYGWAIGDTDLMRESQGAFRYLAQA